MEANSRVSSRVSRGLALLIQVSIRVRPGDSIRVRPGDSITVSKARSTLPVAELELC